MVDVRYHHGQEGSMRVQKFLVTITDEDHPTLGVCEPANAQEIEDAIYHSDVIDRDSTITVTEIKEDVRD